MGWVSRSSPALVEAIVASFSASREEAFGLLSPFTSEEWAAGEYWLDTSGLALYFLDVVQTRRLRGAVDGVLIEKLQQKLVDNKVRLAEMLGELAAINRGFRKAGVCYANLKGFTLFPDSCPDLSLRHISDFDFLVDPADMDAARRVLESHGYQLAGSTARSLEFRTAGRIRTSLEGQYDADTRRSAELHIAMDGLGNAGAPAGRDPRLDRLNSWILAEGCFPCLNPVDQFIGQVLHLLGHLRHEHTRASWLLEFRHHVKTRARDATFWHMVRARAAERPEITIALGLSTLLATELFGAFAPPELHARAANGLPPLVRIWAELYGRRAVLADIPGTKLYLLLEDALRGVHPTKSPARTLQRLIPLRRPERMAAAARPASLRERVQREKAELEFLLFRMRFHLREGFRYLIESHRWRRLRAGYVELQRAASFCICQLRSE